MTTAYDFELTTLSGKPMPLAAWRGRPLVIVNTASACALTPQYAGLEALWREYKDRGLVVIGVPCNDFGEQEQDDADSIAAFCQHNYGIDFPMAAKHHVRGRDADPLFRWLAQEGGLLARPLWNFHKYLIARDGGLAGWFSSLTPASAGRFRRKVRRLLDT
ncbi:MAG: glutathione peroxidase [Rhodospirillaceae bacterium]|nr:glutathione peroxidase [Rhodospirillaceae bacterium]